MKNLVCALSEKVASTRCVNSGVRYVTVFSFSGTDPVSFGVWCCSRD